MKESRDVEECDFYIFLTRLDSPSGAYGIVEEWRDYLGPLFIERLIEYIKNADEIPEEYAIGVVFRELIRRDYPRTQERLLEAAFNGEIPLRHRVRILREFHGKGERCVTELLVELSLDCLRSAAQVGDLEAYRENRVDPAEVIEVLVMVGDTRAIPLLKTLMERRPTTHYVEALVELGDFSGVQWMLEWIGSSNVSFVRGMEAAIVRHFSPPLAPWTDDWERGFVMDSARKLRPKLPTDLRAQIDHVLETVTITGLEISVHIEVLDLVPRVIYHEGDSTEHQEPIADLDLTPLSRCTKLRKLNISKNGGPTIYLSPLRECKALEYFECLNDEPFFLEISPLFDCPHLSVVKTDRPIYAQPHLKERRDIPQGILAIMDIIRWEKPDRDDYF